MIRNETPAIIREDPEGRAARIARDNDGGPIGVALFLTPTELADIGVNTDAADSVELQIEDGEVRLIPICRK